MEEILLFLFVLLLFSIGHVHSFFEWTFLNSPNLILNSDAKLFPANLNFKDGKHQKKSSEIGITPDALK